MTGAGTVATGSREDWYTRKGEITQTELMEALVEAEPFTFVRLQGVVLPYASRDPTVRPPPALAALKLEDVMTLEWSPEQHPNLRIGPTIPFWDPRITASMLRKGQITLSKEETEWRLKTGEHRRNLWKLREGRPIDRERRKQLEDAYLKHKEAYKQAHKEQLKAEKKTTTLQGVAEAEAALAARAPPVQTRTGKEQVEEEEEEEDAEFEMVVRQSLRPPPRDGGAHDVEAGTSGVVRQRAVTPIHSPSPVTGAAVTGAAPISPARLSGSPVQTPQQGAGGIPEAQQLWDSWFQMGLAIRAVLSRNAGPGGAVEDPLVTQLLDSVEESERGQRGDGSDGQ